MIATFCTRGSLASLAQVHTSYQEEAECALYHKLYIYTDYKEVTCLYMLSTNPRRASMVNSLTVEFPSKWDHKSRTAAASLFKALYHMQALSDLRVRLPVDNTVDPLQEQLNCVLQSVGSKLFYV
jgi:hypothetical protein